MQSGTFQFKRELPPDPSGKPRRKWTAEEARQMVENGQRQVREMLARSSSGSAKKTS